MRFLRFLARELLIHGALFTVAGTAILSLLYLLSIGAPPESFAQTGQSFLLLLSGSKDFSIEHPGFSAGQIIASGAAVTLPLALASLFLLTIVALFASAFATTARYLAGKHGQLGAEAIQALHRLPRLRAGRRAAVRRLLGARQRVRKPGAVPPDSDRHDRSWADWPGTPRASSCRTCCARWNPPMRHVFTTLGRPLGGLFPFPGTFSGYLFSSSLPRFIPYLAGKVPAIIGAVTIGEIVFSFPGLGSTLLEALLATNTDLLVASVFILLCVNAVVAFIVKSFLFLIYPRWYEKAL